MTLSPAKGLFVSSGEEFLSEIQPSIMQPRNFIGLEWMQGIEDENCGWSDTFDTQKGVLFIDLRLLMTTEHDLSALNCKPAQVSTVIHLESKVWAPETVEDRRLRSSRKAHCKDNAVLLVVNLGTLTFTEYSSMMFIPTNKRIIERLEATKIPP